jgi:hypothetical protein
MVLPGGCAWRGDGEGVEGWLWYWLGFAVSGGVGAGGVGEGAGAGARWPSGEGTCEDLAPGAGEGGGRAGEGAAGGVEGGGKGQAAGVGVGGGVADEGADGLVGDEKGPGFLAGQAGSAGAEDAAAGEVGLGLAVGCLDGLITNDKFCCVRQLRLRLTWWHQPLRLRGSALQRDVVLSGEPDDPDVERLPPAQPAPRRRAPVGSGLSAASALGRTRRPAGSDADHRGGA